MHSGYRLRGIEITAKGWCLLDKHLWILEMDKTNERVALVSITSKVQKHLKSGLAWKLSQVEKSAFKALKGKWRGRPFLVTLTGVLTTSSKKMPTFQENAMT